MITGASRGIGLATAKEFRKNGWFVLGTSTSGGEFIQLDLRDESSISAAASKIKTQHPQIDVLINNAGIGIEPDENKMDMQMLRSTLEVNLIGTISFTEKILESITGHVIFVSSKMASLVEFDSGICPAYCISKTALNMYGKTLADRLKNITVSAFDPGWVKTDMGGPGAPRNAETPAKELFTLANSKVATGHFWFKGKTRSW